ncbi:MAG: ion channel [Gallionella sp.]|nr:ion channel [Gallionella sp.]MDD4957944.1 ion channel [Gallionella sp.]
MTIRHLLGIAGVEAHETPQARKWAANLEWPMLAVAFWIPCQWYLEETNSIPMILGRIADWLVWLIFVFESVLLTRLVKRKARYLRNNWMNVLIIIGSVPLIWHYTPLAGLLRSLRLLLVVFLLTRLSKNIRAILGSHQLGSTLAVAFFTMAFSGIIITRLDPTMGNAWDGMMSTVGYGDVVPTNGAGRLFGAFLILFGVVLVSLLTANISAYLIGGEVKKMEHEEHDAEVLLRDIVKRLERIERKLADTPPPPPDA